MTSDSDFAYLCRKLRERGATVHIVGEAKSPDALRNASDQFFEWVPPPKPIAMSEPVETTIPKQDKPAPEAAKKEEPKPVGKQRPKFVVDAVTRHGRRQDCLESAGFVFAANLPLVLSAGLRSLRPARHAAHLQLALS